MSTALVSLRTIQAEAASFDADGPCRRAPRPLPFVHAHEGWWKAIVGEAADEPCALGRLGAGIRAGVLGDLLARVRRVEADARVTSTFYEPRPGRLHSGYDIGLDAGTPVPCAWSGRVKTITPWYGAQTGITVVTQGIEVTYGHLSPEVKVGDEIVAGQTVGRVVYDHVDVKMYADGAYIDYAVVNPFVDPRFTDLANGAAAALDSRRLATAPRPLRVTFAARPTI